jgi:hypothetical protein
MGIWLLQQLEALGAWLVHTDVGLGLLLLVGLSMSLSHVFALLANRLTARQILVHLLLDGLMLSLAFLLCCSTDMVLLSLFAASRVHPSDFLNGVAVCLLPAALYVFVAAPYVSDLIALVIWVLVHLNVVSYLHVRFDLPLAQALELATPGFVLALLLVWILFRQSWRNSYVKLASQLNI